jgi:hypothetical protein
MMMTPVMTLMIAQSLRHIKREKSMLPMEIQVKQREILAIMNQSNHPALVIQGEIERERNPLSLILPTDAMHVPGISKFQSEPTNVQQPVKG